MGNAQANLTKQTLSDYTSNVNQTVVNVFNQAIQNCSAGNSLAFETGNGCYFEITDGTFNINQTATSNCTFNSQDVVQATAQFKNQIQNTTQQFIQQESQNKQGWFATAFSFQVNGAETAEEVSNLISNFFQGNFTNRCTQVANSFNAAKVNLCGVYSGTTFNFNQAALTTALTSCVNEIIVSVFTTNSVLNQLWQQTDQKLYSEQSGFDSIFKWLIVLAAIIGAVIIIGFIIFLIIDARKPKQPSPQNIPMMAMQPTGLTSTRTSTRIPI